MAHMYTELQMIKEALQKYQNLMDAGFTKSTYIISQMAVAYHNIRGFFFFQVVKKFPPSLSAHSKSHRNNHRFWNHFGEKV